MKNPNDANSQILTEILWDDPAVRTEFIKHFRSQANVFAQHMSVATAAWRTLDTGIGGSQKLAFVSALVYTAITLHVRSMKLFLAGELEAAGNLFRQVVECMALALLCSNQDLLILSLFMKGKYSTHKAVKDLRAHAEEVGAPERAIKDLEKGRRFYHQYSHPTAITIANLISYQERGASLYVGASFDHGKLELYRKEANARANLAQTFVSFIELVKTNVAKWRIDVQPN